MQEAVETPTVGEEQLQDVQHLQQSSSLLLSIMQLPFPVALYEGKRHVLQLANPAYQSLIATPLPLGRPALEFFGAASGDLAWFHTLDELDEVYRTGYAVRRNERLRVAVKAGTQENRFFDSALLPLLDDAGLIQGVIVTASEVTEQVCARQRAEASAEEARRHSEEARSQAENANRLKDGFLATVSHELRTPMAALLLWENILRSAKDEPMRARALDAIHQSASAQSKLIDDLLDVSRCISGKLRIDLRPVPIVSVVEAALEAALPIANAKGIRMDSFLDRTLGEVMGDPDRLQQIVGNLLSNAIKFTDPAGSVTVRAERCRSHVQVAVVDTGQGIAADLLPEIFKPFTQGDRSVTRNQGGLGLGLAIVGKLVELHGGVVRAESSGPQRGATIIVTLPLHDPRRGARAQQDLVSDEKARLKPRPASPHPATVTGLHILVVDDEPRVREALMVVLCEAGAAVTAVPSAAAAIAALRQSPCDVVVSDIGMPEEDGFSFMQRLRGLPDDQGANIPAIALTAYARAEDRLRAAQVGFDLHLAKPVDADVLITAIAALAGKGQHAQAGSGAESVAKSDGE
ncbi:MAG TPA: ATP-binding protein [Polyangia bacterium]|jgi:signal transduction histidine kinase/ActR/RegA family two-component response regulator|nr:ATP-binding protein [Polyangia bacterium]